MADNDQISLSQSFQPSIWYVAFLDREREDWFDLLSPSWARHVMAFAYLKPLDCWLFVDPKLHRHEISVVPDHLVRPVLTEMYMHEVKILRIDQQSGNPYNARIGNWCTQTIARLVGVRSRAFRPIALYRDLIRSGAVPAYEESDEHQDQSAGDPGRPGDQETPRAG